ncbi:response regulator [Acetivibrio cellulolyticus]|uniref:response regulator n=1 Tax=Acetivibrio cellulolyticus TaxID=35830 RepID=UPI0001E2F57B|nr:response regulator transcription factor [Acetivibrio cellulolyticus]
MIKVIIADDQEIIREGIKYLIEQDPEIEVLGVAGNGSEALELCETIKPDVVLMDIVMPEVSGVESTLLIKEKYPDIKVIILTTFNHDENISKALENGADGYILKDIKPKELILAVKSAASGLRVLHKDAFPSIVKKVSDQRKMSLIQKDELTNLLTPREIEIINLVVDGKDNRDIANSLFISEGTVRNTISLILKKLNLRDRIQLAVYAVKNDIG